MGPKKAPSIETIYQLVEEIREDLSTKATEKGLNDLINIVKERDDRIEALESKILIMENVIEKLQKNVEANEQYSRRTSLRILNIPLPQSNLEHETADDCLDKVKDVILEAELNFNDDTIDRAHRVGKVVEKRERNGSITKQQAMIVKFSTWRHRTILYRARKKLSSKKIFLDLTKDRFNLLKLCQNKCENNKKVKYIFADVNCSLCVRLANDKYIHFETEAQLDDILKKYVG